MDSESLRRWKHCHCKTCVEYAVMNEQNGMDVDKSSLISKMVKRLETLVVVR